MAEKQTATAAVTSPRYTVSLSGWEWEHRALNEFEETTKCARGIGARGWDWQLIRSNSFLYFIFFIPLFSFNFIEIHLISKTYIHLSGTSDILMYTVEWLP